jgi:ABC-type transport system substrate-binding protein
MNVVASQWKAVGAQVSEMIIPTARSSDREYGATYPTALVTTNPASAFISGRYHSKEVRSAANRWASQNRAGYANPAMDTLLDRATVTINQTERTALIGQLLQAQMGDVVVIPLFWNVLPVLQLKGVKSNETVSAPTTFTTWNFFEFDKE